MQETRYDGTSELTDDPTLQEFLEAMGEPRNRTISLHKPGTIVTTQEGRFLVGEFGAWSKVLPDEVPDGGTQ